MSEGGVVLSEVQKKAAADAFSSYDKRGDGQLKVGDIQQAMRKVGHQIKPDWLEKMQDRIDTDGKGFIEVEEFQDIIRQKMQDDEDERELRDIFRVLDKEKKGEVNVDELRWIMKNLDETLTEEEVEDLINEVDTDGSGWVDYDEFAKLMLSE